MELLLSSKPLKLWPPHACSLFSWYFTSIFLVDRLIDHFKNWKIFLITKLYCGPNYDNRVRGGPGMLSDPCGNVTSRSPLEKISSSIHSSCMYFLSPFPPNLISIFHEGALEFHPLFGQRYSRNHDSRNLRLLWQWDFRPRVLWFISIYAKWNCLHWKELFFFSFFFVSPFFNRRPVWILVKEGKSQSKWGFTRLDSLGFLRTFDHWQLSCFFFFFFAVRDFGYMKLVCTGNWIGG